VYLLGPTGVVPEARFEELECVERVVRIREKYRSIGRHGDLPAVGFEYNGVRMSQDTLHVFPGLCAVDTVENVDRAFATLAAHGLVTARAGAYKPRTSPYDFQGLGRACLPWVFERAGRHGIRVIAMEVTHESHIDEIRDALAEAGQATGVMLQIGTRNAQNFELLKAVGQAHEFPVLFKRGMGITLEESLNACEYVATGGNRRIVFCLRGVKSHLGEPHRNFVDFAHVPVVKRLTRLPVCVDPSHSVGRRSVAPDGLTDIHHVAAQGVIAGANMLLVDIHPDPDRALCDGPQALRPHELPAFLDDVAIVRRAYEQRAERARAAGAVSPGSSSYAHDPSVAT
jgi:3-deoxy-7-phosphoheptulonate synthase